jgi:hypothetical protein
MRLLKDNTISLTKSERKDFFTVFNPNVKDPESQEKVIIKDLDEASWVKFAFESMLEEANETQKKVWSRAADVLRQLCDRLHEQEMQEIETTSG